jgi:NADH-quinone oxidoreductase subunit L
MEHPGILYVVATLLPLASFVLLLLAGGVRALARAYRTTPLGGSVFRLMGGDKPGRLGSFIATAAIAAAFVLCLIGFIQFQQDPANNHEAHGATTAAHGETGKTHGEGTHAAESRWAQSWSWIQMDFPSKRGTELALGYRIDHLSSIMFLMVTFIATLIHLFSMGYMEEELKPEVEDHDVPTGHGHLHRRGRFGRFFMFLSLFCFSMLNLLLADNLFQVFISWELVGLCSYLLIGFYYERRSASNAANKAFITNRVGDAGFILGMLILWAYVGTFNFEDIFRAIRLPGVVAQEKGPGPLLDRIVRARAVGEPEHDIQKLRVDADGDQAILFADHFDAARLGGVVEAADALGEEGFGHIPYWLLVIAGLGIFLGCVGKSAQFPLHVWLPDAMEGPTPVSALIHAATMVAAGVYLVGRCYPLFTPEARLIIAYTGGITLFVAATIALVMTDIKKVLAYSTVSQLGYMMLALGVGGWAAGLFHLITHAFFKALLFLCSGSVIYGCHHQQDMGRMGGLFKKMPITAVTMLIGVLAISGIPLFSGWYSKDAVIAAAYGFIMTHPSHLLLFLLPLVTAGITAFYMFRMWYMTFTGKPRDHHVHEHAMEAPPLMTIPLILLAIASVVVAWGYNPVDAEASLLEAHIHHAQPRSAAVELAEEIKFAAANHGFAGALALGLVLASIFFATVVYRSKALDPADAVAQFPGVHRFLEKKWYFDELYSVLFVRPALVAAKWCSKFDLLGIDSVLHGTAKATVQVARWDGAFDKGVIDGLANLTGRVFYSTGSWLKNVQTGFLRSYVLFLALGAVCLLFLLTLVLSVVKAG